MLPTLKRRRRRRRDAATSSTSRRARTRNPTGLPAPKGPFFAVLALVLAERGALNGTWRNRRWNGRNSHSRPHKEILEGTFTSRSARLWNDTRNTRHVRAREVVGSLSVGGTENGHAIIDTEIDSSGRPRVVRDRDGQDPARGFRVQEQLSNRGRRDTTAGGAGLQSRRRSVPRADARRLLVSRLERHRGSRSENAESGRAVGEPDGRRDAPAHRQLPKPSTGCARST